MDAYISGRAGIAILQEGETLSSLDVSALDTPVTRRPAEVRLLLTTADDFRLLEDVTASRAAQELQQAYDCVCALDLALLTLDADLTATTRRKNAEVFDKLCAKPAVTAYIESILYAHPLPAEADLAGALQASTNLACRPLWQTLADRQPAIQAVCEQWRQLPFELFDAAKPKDELHRFALKTGLFRDLAKGYATPALNTVQVQALQKLPQYSEALMKWIQPLTKSDTMATPDVNNDKVKAIKSALANSEKQFGKGSIMKLGNSRVEEIPVISTSSIGIDAAIGVGGVPRGCIIEIFGTERSGKTTLALHIVAEAQKDGGIAAYVDAEHALNAAYAEKLGVNVNNLFVSQPDSAEQALEITESLVRSNAIDVLVVDSVVALPPRAKLEGDMGDSLPGLQARLMSQALRKLTAVVGRSNTCLIFINQISEKIGVMFGSPETTNGGRALKFYSSVRLDIRCIGAIKDGDAVTGNRTKVKVVKNKVAPPFKEAEFDIIQGEGISKWGEIIDLGVEHKIIEKRGNWFSYRGELLGQGRENAKSTLRDNAVLRTHLETELRAVLEMPVKTQPHATLLQIKLASTA